MRKARTTSRTATRFIAADDEAIGAENLNVAYGAYMQTQDESALELKEGTPPAFYHLKVLPLDLQTRIRDVLTTDGDEGSTIEAMLSPAGREVLYEFVNRCLIACDGHPIVDRVRPDGSFDDRVIVWAPGTPRPSDLTDAIVGEETLAINMFWFVFRTSQLSDNEKKP